MKTYCYFLICCLLLFASCSSSDSIAETMGPSSAEFKILALGDSYTIGESVSNEGRFPNQLRDQLQQRLDTEIFLKIIARTGWTTSNLESAIKSEDISTDYDIVTLLIGVNNQFQQKPFSLYEEEFPILLDRAINYAKGNAQNVIVLSIPDYAFTPFGQNQPDPQRISDELDAYNAYAKSVSEAKNATFINVTNITRRGLSQPNLVASDGLHPSSIAYEEFVSLLLPVALEIIE